MYIHVGHQHKYTTTVIPGGKSSEFFLNPDILLLCVLIYIKQKF